jgi:hypothetical protein
VEESGRVRSVVEGEGAEVEGEGEGAVDGGFVGERGHEEKSFETWIEEESEHRHK